MSFEFLPFNGDDSVALLKMTESNLHFFITKIGSTNDLGQEVQSTWKLWGSTSPEHKAVLPDPADPQNPLKYSEGAGYIDIVEGP